jgi:hypothetical protein
MRAIDEAWACMFAARTGDEQHDPAHAERHANAL